MIGERLLDLRKDAGLTQDDLAAVLKINKHSISSYERDKCDSDSGWISAQGTSEPYGLHGISEEPV